MRYAHQEALEGHHGRGKASRVFLGAVSQLEWPLPGATGLHPWSLSHCVVSHSWWMEAAIRNQPAGRGWQDHDHMPVTGSLEVEGRAELGTSPVMCLPSVSTQALVR